MFVSGHAVLSNYRFWLYPGFFFFFFTVIGGKNVFLRLSLSGESYSKVSVWKKLQKEVLYFSFWFVCFFFSGK